ncbi:MAG TPA: S8/S53 family peptidase [Pyrinomonadaceae bacterium]|nr:S8/S53 family peptidase [Pyrinomonadaceae bacterium]
MDPRWWLPGVIVVEFNQRLSPGSIFGFTDSVSDESKKYGSWLDVTKLRKLVGNLLVKPPEWTFSFKPGQVPSRPNYERFITFNLRPEVDVPAIAKKLSEVGGVVRATPEPILSPPIPYIPLRATEMAMADSVSDDVEAGLRDEPLAVSGGQSFGVQVNVGTAQLQNQWYLFRSNLDAVVESGINGTGVVVAAVDWGFNVDHQEFQDRIKFKYNAAQDNNDLSSGPRRWHGTASLGLIGAGDNDAGMLGFASGADLWAIQGQDSGSNLNNQCWAQAIEKAIDEPSGGKRKVILIEASTNGGFNVEASTTLRVPIMAAIEDGCVVCVAAGNRGVDAKKAPNNAQIPESGSILVGATQYRANQDDIRRGISNWGSRIVVSAPGELSSDVTCCDCGPDSYTNSFGGTSGASAKVAGAMALLLQAHPHLTHSQIVDVLKTRMPQITTSDRPMGCFLDIEELMEQVDLYLSEQ